MFVFTLVISILLLVASAAFAVWSYLAFRSDTGGNMDFIGSIMGMVFGAIAAVLGVIGGIGVSIIANRVWG